VKTYRLELPGMKTDVAVTPHALERYSERVRPAETRYGRLHEDMVRLVAACGHTSSEPPVWANEEDWNLEQPRERIYVHCGDVALVVQHSPEGSRLPGAVVTVLVRGGISETARAKRNAHRGSRTWRKTHKDREKMPRRHVSSRQPILEE
jgi:hypothetical protein